MLNPIMAFSATRRMRSFRTMLIVIAYVTALLLLSLALYGLVILIAARLLGLPLLSEAVNARQSVPLRIAVEHPELLLGGGSTAGKEEEA